MELPAISRQREIQLVLATLASKLAVVLFSVFVLVSYVDLYDINIYYTAMGNLLQGHVPWYGGTAFFYPPLALVPMMAAYLASVAVGAGFTGFVVGLNALMIACDIVTTFCVYYVALRMYPEEVAARAALLSATAISVAFFVLTRYDSFPACLAMLALTAAVYGRPSRGYWWSVAGFFAKLWPLFLFPFLWLYHSKDSSPWIEARRRALRILAIAAVAFVVMLVVGYNQFLTYAGMIYVQTLPYLLSQYMAMVAPGLPFSVIRDLCLVGIMAVILWGAILVRQDPGIPSLVKAIALSVFAVAYLNQYQSPQYIVWVTPFLALLVADDPLGALAFVAVQVLAYVEFPLVFWHLWINTRYTSPAAIPFFTVFYAAWAFLLWRAVRCDPQEVPGAKGGSP